MQEDRSPDETERGIDLPTSVIRRPARLTLYSGVTLVLAGIVILFLGYDGAASHSLVPAQIPFLISGGILGGVVTMLGGMAVGVFAVIHSNAQLREELIQMRESMERVTQTLGAAAAASEPGETVHLPSGGTTYHKQGCRVIARAREPITMLKAQAIHAGYSPCRICRP